MATTKTPTKKTAKRASRAVTKTARSAPKPVRKRVAARPSNLDAIAELKRDHRKVEQLFKRFEKAGDGAYRTKRAIVDSVIEELSRHAAIEEMVLYPAIRREVSREEASVLEALEEHHSVKISLQELERLDASHERFDAKMTVLIEHVRHHVNEEEEQLFPEVRKAMARGRLLELGAELRESRPHVPSRPHPAAPDEPPANLLVGGAVAVIDRARKVGKRVVDHVLD